MASVLFMGIGGDDPSLQLPPNVSSQQLNEAIDKGSQSLTDAGYKVTLFLPPMLDGIAALEKELQSNKHDLVLVGVSDGHNMCSSERSLLTYGFSRRVLDCCPAIRHISKVSSIPC
jgi:hypothetical protein